MIEMRLRALILSGATIVAMLGVLASPQVGAEEGQFAKVGSIESAPCHFEFQDNAVEANCGVLVVPENYDQPQGSAIRLPFVVFWRTAPLVPPTDLTGDGNTDERVAAPIQNLAPVLVAGGGGPGGHVGISSESLRSATMEEIFGVYRYISTYHGRPLILIDNRGVGSSIPKLSCTNARSIEFELLTTAPTADRYARAIAGEYEQCAARLARAGVDIGQYNLLNAARDIEVLRAHLGYERLNVYGVSYGSRVALMYEHMYPERAQSLILDGVYPLFIKPYVETYNPFDSLFARCEQDANCSERYGKDLRDDLAAKLRALETRPVSISVTRNDTFTPVNVKVTPDLLVTALFNAMYTSWSYSELPRTIRSISEGATDHLAALIRTQVVDEIVSDQFEWFAFYVYGCSEDQTFIDPDGAKATALRQDMIEKNLWLHWSAIDTYVCRALGIDPVEGIPHNAEKITTPVLMFSGELDPITPPSFARRLSQNTSVSWHKVFSNVSHGVLHHYAGCASEITKRFLDFSPGGTGPDTTFKIWT